jgi:uncharacterized membrane protein
MAKKPKRYAGKTEEEWKDWGLKFGKRMKKRGKEFGEEMENLGERIEKHFGRKGKKWSREYRDWWFFSLGFIGPLIGSIFGIICIALLVWVLKFVNLPLSSPFISTLSNFFITRMHWFFVFFLFFGYGDYFHKRYQKTFWTVSPIFSSIGVVIAIWVLIWILNLINNYIGSSLIASVSKFIYVNLAGIFVLLLFLGYLVVIVKKFAMNMLSD